MKCKPDTVRVLVVRNWPSKYVAGEEICASIADVRERPLWFAIKDRGATVMKQVVCCGGDIAMPTGVRISYLDNPDLFELCTVQNHADTPTSISGKSGRNYSTRKNGDQVYVLKVDIPGDDRFEPIV